MRKFKYKSTPKFKSNFIMAESISYPLCVWREKVRAEMRARGWKTEERSAQALGGRASG